VCRQVEIAQSCAACRRSALISGRMRCCGLHVQAADGARGDAAAGAARRQRGAHGARGATTAAAEAQPQRCARRCQATDAPAGALVMGEPNTLPTPYNHACLLETCCRRIVTGSADIKRCSPGWFDSNVRRHAEPAAHAFTLPSRSTRRHSSPCSALWPLHYGRCAGEPDGARRLAAGAASARTAPGRERRGAARRRRRRRRTAARRRPAAIQLWLRGRALGMTQEPDGQLLGHSWPVPTGA